MASEIQSKGRISSIDALRGLVMIIMALDHVRDFYHTDALAFQPDDLARTTAALFFTRWITHFCAPAFMFTAGLGAYFWMRAGRKPTELSAFLWKRGIWLIVLELTVMRLAINPRFFSGPVVLITLWALGWSMVVLGFLARLPLRPLAAISVAMIALHNLADPVQAATFGGAAWVWNVLHQPGAFQTGGITFVAGYPLIPWIGVMALGYCFGPSVRNRQLLMRIGPGMTIGYVVLRAINVYGDPSPWNGTGLLSFLRCTKYPPSLDFLLMTLGPSILVLSWFDRLTFTETNPLIVFGRVPLFYFVAHFYLARGFSWVLGRTEHLWAVYLLWISIVIIMYPFCLWYMRLKKRHPSTWLSYS